jgi:hypothetical protein
MHYLAVEPSLLTVLAVELQFNSQTKMKKEILSSTYPSKLNKRFRFYHGGFLNIPRAEK